MSATFTLHNRQNDNRHHVWVLDPGTHDRTFGCVEGVAHAMGEVSRPLGELFALAMEREGARIEVKIDAGCHHFAGFPASHLLLGLWAGEYHLVRPFGRSTGLLHATPWYEVHPLSAASTMIAEACIREGHLFTIGFREVA